MNILNEIAQKTRERISSERQQKPLESLKAEVEALMQQTPQEEHRFLKALQQNGMSFICEVKKASPSKGLIAPDFPYLSIAKEYEAAGAAAISCLTEPFWFLGSDQYLKEIAAAVRIPVLRKDFVVDEYMIWQAKLLGASAVLLICSILTDEELLQWRMLAESLGMDALVEAHDEEEVHRAIRAGARIIGVNNRDLKTFTIDMNNSIRLRNLAPDSTIFVSESGIRTAEDIEQLYDHRVDAVLIGETLMRSPDKRQMLDTLRGSTANRTKIKVCGLRRKEDIEAVNECKPDYAGFVIEVPGSRRSVSEAEVRKLTKDLDPAIVPVGVFVDSPMELIERLLKDGVIEIAQLHGSEDEAYLNELRKRTGAKIIKAFSIRTREDVEKALESSADYILLDQGSGGTGKTFDWNLVPEIKRPFFLAGGLSAENLSQAIAQLHPWAVDLSSSLETDHKKDIHKIRQAVTLVRQRGE